MQPEGFEEPSPAELREFAAKELPNLKQIWAIDPGLNTPVTAASVYDRKSLKRMLR